MARFPRRTIHVIESAEQIQRFSLAVSSSNIQDPGKHLCRCSVWWDLFRCARGAPGDHTTNPRRIGDAATHPPAIIYTVVVLPAPLGPSSPMVRRAFGFPKRDALDCDHLHNFCGVPWTWASVGSFK